MSHYPILFVDSIFGTNLTLSLLAVTFVDNGWQTIFLDPDQDQQDVGPGLDPTGLTL